MQRIIDLAMLIGIVICVGLFIHAYMSRVDRLVFSKPDCVTLSIPKEKGKFCMKRDYKGNIYYVRASSDELPLGGRD